MLESKRLMVKYAGRVEATAEVELRTEAEQVAQILADARGKVVVLTGKPMSGKSELIRRWVVPLVSRQGRACYGECSSGLPTRFECSGKEKEYEADWKSLPEGTYFLDAFERLFSLDEQARRESIQAIDGAIEQGRGKVTIALILRDDRLSELFSLRKGAPGIADTLFELPTVDFEEALRRLAAAEPGEGFSYGPEILEALNKDLRAFKDKRGSLLLAELLHPRLVKMGGAVDQYKGAGSMRGLLDEIVTKKLNELRKTTEAKAVSAGWAILKEVAQQGQRTKPSMREISSRLEINETIVNGAYEWLKGPQGMLRETVDGGVEIELPQLAERIREQASQREPELIAAKKIMEEGTRSWRTIGMVLPKKVFDEVNRLRHELKMDQDAAALMAHCAFLYMQEPNLETPKYWFGRIPDEHERVASLMRALVAPEPEVRRKAVHLVRDQQVPGMPVQLYRVALEDPEPTVRSEAVASLKSLSPAPVELREALEAAATTPHTPYRRNAVECLQIFPDNQTIELLCKIARDPEVGDVARRTLAALHLDDQGKPALFAA
jgi:DNA-binding transcriptional regulator YhcF (GntR family)